MVYMKEINPENLSFDFDIALRVWKQICIPLVTGYSLKVYRFASAPFNIELMHVRFVNSKTATMLWEICQPTFPCKVWLHYINPWLSVTCHLCMFSLHPRNFCLLIYRFIDSEPKWIRGTGSQTWEHG